MGAIETGRPVVNVSTGGTRQVIGPHGAVLGGVGVDRTAARVRSVPVCTRPTLVSMLGGGSLTLAGLGVGSRGSRRPGPARHEVAR